MDSVVNADPDIEETETGDDAARGSVERDGGKVRDEKEQAVVAPEVCPGKNDDDKPKVEADDDTHGKLNELQPGGRLLRSRLASAGRRFRFHDRRRARERIRSLWRSRRSL